jgi:hypothetical protein
MHARYVVPLALLLGCGAQLDERNAPVDARVDATTPIDASVPLVPDAPPDARLCAGGDARAVDASTGSCFVYFAGPATYAEAEAACAAFGSSLAVIKSAATNAVVLSLVGQSDAFVGATDLVQENAFRWHTGELVSAGYSNWRSGEPNNGMGSYEEDCMIIEGSRGGTWDDRPCTRQGSGAGAYPYVCQF